MNKPYDYNKADWDNFANCLNALVPSINYNEDLKSFSSKIAKCLGIAADESIPKIESKPNRIESLPPFLVNLKKLKNYWRRRAKRSDDAKENYYSLKESFKLALWKFSNDKMNGKGVLTLASG